ncbi:hypothetical protein CC80DRAFT_497849 [Byssothecium circinans]|uniref:Uncharacterized protein n=1 Tax=Byssothecium circinans TaxID=147558 RepID=A0A6A5TB34_9PLEO|nr:hypothetical protein CC80DRAFT_497849 [Byssothecium circinans]
MASISKSRSQLQALAIAAETAIDALRIADSACRALRLRADARKRRDDPYSDVEDSLDEDSFGNPEADPSSHPEEEEDSFDLEAATQRLEDERSRCREQVRQAQKAFLILFEKCAKEDVRPVLEALHGAMRERLPLEIRTLIYTYLVSAPWPHHRNATNVVHIGRERCIDEHYRDIIFPARKAAWRFSHLAFFMGTVDVHELGGWLLNPEYVGPAMAREMAEVYYSSKEFHVDDIGHLKELLMSDRSGTGFKPYDFIRGKFTVETTIWLTSPDTTSEYARLHGLYEELNSLNLLTRKSQLEVDIRMLILTPMWMSEGEGVRRLYNVMEAVRTPIYDLRYSGAKVTLKVVTERSFATSLISSEPINNSVWDREAWGREKTREGWVPSENFVAPEEIGGMEGIERLKGLLRRQLASAVVEARD